MQSEWRAAEAACKDWCPEVRIPTTAPSPSNTIQWSSYCSAYVPLTKRQPLCQKILLPNPNQIFTALTLPLNTRIHFQSWEEM